MERCRCIVSGRVQGVGFRFWTQQTARALNLTGWVCNRADNTVELEIHGTEADIAALQELLWKGPTFSTVTNVICTPVQPANEYTDFIIHR